MDPVQVGLFEHADLQLDGHDQTCQRGTGHCGQGREGEAGLGDDHGGEDRVADDPEDTAGDQVGALLLVHADAPRGAHPGLPGKDRSATEHQQRQAGDRHRVGERRARGR